jgi:hypothetical protein
MSSSEPLMTQTPNQNAAPRRRNDLSSPLTALLLTLALAAPLRAQFANTQTLQDLSRQTQSLYVQAAQSVVRVQLPTTLPTAAGAGGAVANAPATTAPAGVPPTFTPNVIGIVVDANGHAMLPMYTTKANCGDAPLHVLLCDGSFADAQFVGSDKPTHITVIQVLHRHLSPMALATSAPAEGAIVMALAVDPSSPRLGVWSRWSSNWGLIIQTDGSAAGFSGRGQFLPAGARAPVIRQIIDHGRVDRPILGVAINMAIPQVVSPVALSGVSRPVNSTGAATPVIFITQVFPDTAAARAGLKINDLIVTLAGQPVSDTASFATTITKQRGPTQLQVLRDGQLLSLTVDLELPPQN